MILASTKKIANMSDEITLCVYPVRKSHVTKRGLYIGFAIIHSSVGPFFYNNMETDYTSSQVSGLTIGFGYEKTLYKVLRKLGLEENDISA